MKVTSKPLLIVYNISIMLLLYYKAICYNISDIEEACILSIRSY